MSDSLRKVKAVRKKRDIARSRLFYMPTPYSQVRHDQYQTNPVPLLRVL